MSFCPIDCRILDSISYTCNYACNLKRDDYNAKKPIVAINEEVYNGLYPIIGPGKMGRFIEELVCPHVLKKDMYAANKEMAADQIRESEAMKWAEGTISATEMEGVSKAISTRLDL